MENYITKDKTIIFSPYFDGEIEPGLLGKYSNVIFSDYELNDNLFEYYELNYNLFEYYEKNKFNDLKYIYSRFNQEVNLPPNLTHLRFGEYFNQPVKLPENLMHLTWCCNRQVILPKKLTHLTFGTFFNQPVELPKKITHLTFGTFFNQPVELPENLTHLSFGCYFNQQVNLPFSIKFLKVDCDNVNIIDYLHSQIFFIKNFCVLLRWPDSIEELFLDEHFNLELNNLPSSIKKLIIVNDNYEHELNCLPLNLECLRLPHYYHKEIKKYPKQLKIIKCHEDYIYIDKIKHAGFYIRTYK